MVDKNVNIILRAKDAASGPIGRVNRALGTMGKVAIGLAATGLGALALGLVNATKAAAEEEKSIAKLDAALKANVKGWTGNKAAIDATIKSRQALAFSDDDLRASLAKLVTATGNVDTALNQQAIAMDLARLKGISLEDASALLIKAQNGNLRALKDLGIQLPKNASATEILTAIQRKAAGQAEAYGRTTSGAFESFQIAVNDLVEDVGARFLPMAADIARWLSREVLPAVERVIDSISRWADENRPLINQIGKFVGGALSALVGGIGTVIGVIAKLVGAIASNRDIMNFLRAVVDAIATAFDLAGRAIGFVAGKIGEYAAAVARNKGLIEFLRNVIGAIRRQFELIAVGIGVVLTGLGRLAKWIATNGPKLQDLVNLLRFLPGPGSQFVGLGLEQRAAGGPTQKGRTYLVGEKGPELWRAPGAGYILPAGQTAAMFGSGGGGGPTVIQLVVDGRIIAEVVDRHNYRKLQRSAPTASPA